MSLTNYNFAKARGVYYRLTNSKNQVKGDGDLVVKITKLGI